MASLFVVKGVNQGQRLPLVADTFVLGRSPGSDLVIPATSVSRQHARVLRIQGRYYLEDMHSRNGTRLNDEVIKARTQLKENDKIQICDFVAQFHESASSASLVTETPRSYPGVDDADSSSTSVSDKVEHSSSVFAEIHSAEKLKVILAVANSLRKTLELDQLAPKLADAMFALFPFAGRCFIILREDPTEECQLVALRTRITSEEPTARFSATIVSKCLDTVQSFLSEELSPPPLPGSIDLKVRSVICVPMCDAEGQAIGAIQLDAPASIKRFTRDDLELLSGVANQASIALENAKLHEELLAREQIELLLEQAGHVQRSILPDIMPELPNFEFFAHYQSALGVGGDFYDFIPLPRQRLAITLGDVAGKGMPAALLMAKICSDMRYCLLADSELAPAVSRLNDLVYPHTSRTDRFVTMAAAVLDPADNSVALINAGHLTPLLYRQVTGSLEAAFPSDLAGTPLGLERNRTYHQNCLTLQPGDSLLFFTDGVPDAVNLQNQAFQIKGIHACIRDGGPHSPRSLSERIIKAVERHASGRSQRDDITLVCFGRRG